MKNILTLIITALLVTTLPLANATTINAPNTIQLQPCQTAQILLQITSKPNQTATLNAQTNANYITLTYPQTIQIQNQQTTIPVIAQIQCDAGIALPGNYPINFALNINGEQTKTNTIINIQNEHALNAQLNYLDKTSCACQAANFQLQLTNYGNNAERGAIIASNPQGFKTAIDQNQYEIPAHSTLNRSIAIAIPCNAQPDAYALEVLIAREYENQEPILQLQSAFITQACYAATTNGPTELELCTGEQTAEYYTLTNTGTNTQTYKLETTFGQIYPDQQITLRPNQQRDFAIIFTAQDTNEPKEGQFALTTLTNTTKEQKAIQVKINNCNQNTQTNTNTTQNQTSNATGLFTIQPIEPKDAIPFAAALILIAAILFIYSKTNKPQNEIKTSAELEAQLKEIARQNN